MSLMKDSLLAACSALIISVTRFVLIAFVARKLGPESLGSFVYILWLVDISFLVLAFGVPGVASRYFAEYRNAPKVLGSIAYHWRSLSYVIPVFSSLLMVLFFWVSNSNPVNFTLYCLAFGWSVGSGLFNMRVAALTGLQRFDLLFLASLLMSLPTYVMCVWNPVYLTLELVLIFMLISFIALT